MSPNEFAKINGRPVQAGDECFYQHIGSPMKATVVKVTPTGLINVKLPSGSVVKFKPNGYSYKAHSAWSRYNETINFDIVGVAAKAKDEKNCIKLCNLIGEAKEPSQLRHQWGVEAIKNHLAELEAKVAAARAFADTL